MDNKLQLKTIINEKELAKKIQEMGETLTDKFRNQPLVAICVLKGSFMFFSDLIRRIEGDLTCEFIGLSSYQGRTVTSGDVRLTMDINSSVKDKHVLLVEDIVDTGLTMKYLQDLLALRGCKSVTTATLLHKPAAKKVDCKVDLVGFTIPNDFVVGYGLDYNNYYRQLPYIARVENLN
jgi:hypoxanthine phosphoribosyltransferase